MVDTPLGIEFDIANGLHSFAPIEIREYLEVNMSKII